MKLIIALTEIQELNELLKNPLFLAGVFAWWLIGLYGVYMASWNTRTHKERWELFKKYSLVHWAENGYLAPLVKVTLLSFTGLLMVAVAATSHHKWKLERLQSKE
jgi:hypothetical protein